jgi:hypothetical protein
MVIVIGEHFRGSEQLLKNNLEVWYLISSRFNRDELKYPITLSWRIFHDGRSESCAVIPSINSSNK